jgi:leucine dehydrogenase
VDLVQLLEAEGTARTLILTDRPSGLRAIVVLDDLRLGPAAGGVRTRSYATLEEAAQDAARLARSMTLKCALAGLSAGGGKAVVMDHPDLDRARAFEVLGRRIEELGGLFHTAGDLGTTARDLQVMARHCRYVHTGESHLADAVARGLVGCIQACVDARGAGTLAGLRVLVQGCGAIGTAVARTLAKAGAELWLVDLDESRARALATELGARALAAGDDPWTAPVDLCVPCAVGGVVTEAVAQRMTPWGLCGGANNVVATAGAGRILARRGILHVPDTIASAGAVTDGIARRVMGLDDPEPRIEGLARTARQVLERARAERRAADEVAEALAWERIGGCPSERQC